MKDYQNDCRHLRLLYLALMTVFFTTCVVLLTAEENAGNEEERGSGEGRWKDS